MPGLAPQYSLGSTDAELRRLIDLASHEQDHVMDACRRAGIGEGASALDLGCGPLGALAALAAVVGPGGSVTGIDASAAALEKARTLLPSSDYPHVQLLRADLNEVTREGAVDLAYCRLVLLHQTDPARSLRRIATLLRPGGVVIAHEPSDLAMHAPASEPPVPAMTRVWELVIAAARSRGAQTDFGLRGRAYFEAAGLVVESHHAYTVHYAPGIGYAIPRAALHSLRPVLAERGLASEEEIERLDRELAAARHRPDVQWVASPLMFEWIARKA
ncbi:MAG TPA: methyltransferase domain-containing protein [Thermoanaerobaculia bacterium]|nr:methyltransferase domain-containing protein [Thermoanaerobaculia bacterium]